MEQLATVTENGVEADFNAFLSGMKDFLGPQRPELARLCARVYEGLPSA